MPRHLRFLVRLASVTSAAALCAAVAFTAEARVESASPHKRYQAALLMREPMRERAERKERAKELRELARELKRRGASALLKRGDKIKSDVIDEDLRAGRLPAPTIRRAVPAPARASAPPTANVRANNPAGDNADEGQCETSIAAYGPYLVAAWNDSKGWRDGTGQTQGWATSTDGGATWTDQGALPVPSAPANWKWSSDPVVTVNPNTGAFFYCGLGDGANNVNGIGVLKGRFTGGTFTWSTRVAARTADPGAAFLDKQWLAVDPSSGRVYLSYTNFTSNIDQIEFQTADSTLTTWSNPLKLSTATEDGYVQGSRPVVGPDGTVYVVWYQIGLVDVDYLRITRSTNQGGTFSAPATAISFFTNYGTGAPGFNRSSPIPQFPGVAVDHSSGTHRGRLYLAWQESLNWLDDEPNTGTGAAVSEVEPDDAPANATAFTPGALLRGALSSVSDFDYFKVNLNAGQTLIVEADSSGSGLVSALRLFAADGTTRLTWTVAPGTDVNAGYRIGWIWTAPANGTYYVRVAAQSGQSGYRLRTGLATRGAERGTDQRDVFVAHSDNGGGTWSTPVRVDDAPVGHDGWLPEVAVDALGRVYCGWYDWRDGAPGASGGESSIYLSRSTDGGASWTSLGAASDTLSNWTNCQSYIAPNQGDYMSLYASATKLAVCWSDARGGSPDVYTSVWPIGATAATATLASAAGFLDRVELEWVASPPDSFSAAVQRSVAGGPWVAVDTVGAQPNGQVTYTDTDVVPGTTYGYRLGILTGGGVTYAGYASVLVPSGLALAVRGAVPNPTDGANGALAFTLPFAEAATLEVFDLTGRLVHSQSLSGLAAASHTIPFPRWPSARSGVYLIRISQRGAHATTRVTLVR